MKYVRTNQGDTAVLSIEGELDAFTAPELRPLLEAIASEQVRKVVVDLTELSLVDSSGVGAIVSLYKRVRANEGELRIRGLNGQPLAIFKLLNLDRVFPLE
jgi:anti-sigma B factor antagonist